MRVLVCGSRVWTDRHMVGTVLSGLLDVAMTNFEQLVIIEGCHEEGADYWAHHFYDGPCDQHHGGHTHVDHEHYPADWVRYGKPAGMIRNRAMLRARPDLVVAFKDGFGTQFHPDGKVKGGTENMVRIAKEASVSCWIMSHG